MFMAHSTTNLGLVLKQSIKSTFFVHNTDKLCETE